RPHHNPRHSQRGAGPARPAHDPAARRKHRIGRALRRLMIPPALLVLLATRSLLVHKLRSFLSILGVIFGVAAVVAMSSVGEGARRESLAQIGALGVARVTWRARAPAAGASPGPGLSLADAESVGRVVPGVRAVAP